MSAERTRARRSRSPSDALDDEERRKARRTSGYEVSQFESRDRTKPSIRQFYSVWEQRRSMAGCTPLLFRGNRAPTPCIKSRGESPLDVRDDVSQFQAPPGPPLTNITDRLLDFAETDETKWRSRMLDEAELGLDFEELRNVDRQWYDSEESNYFQHEGRYEEDLALADKEEHLKYRQGQLDTMRRRQKLNLRESVRNADQQLWEMNRLRQSGLSASSMGLSKDDSTLQSLYELPTADIDSDAAVHVLVRELKPPFLDGRITYTTQIDPVSVIKDPTSDLAVLAKRGSAVLRHLRDEEDKTKMRQRFWEVSGTTMGNIVGVAQKEKTKEELQEEQEAVEAASANDEDDVKNNYKKGSQFAKLLTSQKDTAVSEFARNRTLAEQRRALPIYEARDEFLSLLRSHQIVIVVGQTGSGKTTQLTQYLHEDGYTRCGIIGCTQPRRVAAVSVAKRVADEMEVVLGDEVGYAIRFEDCTSSKTIIQYMTDGILLRESLIDPDLDRYSVIVMDEAHERSLNTDILFGILRGVVAHRHDFRLIVTSATMNAEKFSAFFGGVPIFDIPGRTFPVRVEYVRTPVDDYVDSAVQRALQIHCSLAGGTTEGGGGSSDGGGDILIFMTGQEDIEATCLLLADRAAKLGEKIPPLSVMPIYSTLPADLQAKIFQRSDNRKVIVATNIAETSLTVDGIRYVIDCGYSKLKVYNPKIGMDSLQITPISQANARQRSGRAGRTGPGVCYRLYTERAFVSEMFENNIPEIQRTNLCHTVLLLKSLGVKNLLEFDFMDPPPQETILSSMYQLWVLGALDNLGSLTETGSQMVQFPLDPPLSKMLLTASTLKCAAEVLIIVSMLSVPSVFYRPKDRTEESDAAREKFFVAESDHLTLLNAYLQWKRNNCSPQWANDHFVHQKAMKKVREVRSQLLDIMQQQKVEHISSGTDWDVVRKAICSGYFHNASKLRGIGEYVNLITSIPCHLHPSSSLFGAGVTPEYIVYHEVVLTTKEYMQNVTAVEPQWLAELGPMFFYLKESTSSLADKRQEEREAISAQEREFQMKMSEDMRKRKETEFLEGQRQQSGFRIATPGIKVSRFKTPLTSTYARNNMTCRPDTPLPSERHVSRPETPRRLHHLCDE
ncbi:LOW QUALITY PROTEIN: uncharacterized protein LOC129617831 [Condylostylus longicornis]|uniref:LOW QUALITY PROTEIN: uncharacterized protein LOC129617831 n=1 Tax=Condylostylus longicornis TaxID=2530218 RepID=UPI00244E4DEC|nr:LOW QUALITY PROTEIN: uncharacterized protein LOC129617831 [Condylostylus longicornis]